MQGVVKESGTVQFVKITRKHIRDALARRASTPHAANNFLIAMNLVFRWALDHDHVEVNPCDGVRPIAAKIEGHHTWTEEEVAAYRAKHPVGTVPRLALDLLLFTGLRRSDVFRVGRQHVKEGVLSIRMEKTGKAVHIPVFSELQQSIDATPTGDLVFLTTAKGSPFSSASSFGGWFRKACNDAGLPHCSAHGLRKAGATIAANAGATPHELMAMYGWARLAMAEIYTRDADRKRLARGAAERIANRMTPHLK
jgi:integrase